MALAVNDTTEFPGAATVIRPPITGDDCTNFPTFEELVESEEVVGHGCTIRSGYGWAVKSVAEIEVTCEAE